MMDELLREAIAATEWAVLMRGSIGEAASAMAAREAVSKAMDQVNSTTEFCPHCVAKFLDRVNALTLIAPTEPRIH